MLIAGPLAVLAVGGLLAIWAARRALKRRRRPSR